MQVQGEIEISFVKEESTTKRSTGRAFNFALVITSTP